MSYILILAIVVVLGALLVIGVITAQSNAPARAKIIEEYQKVVILGSKARKNGSENVSSLRKDYFLQADNWLKSWLEWQGCAEKTIGDKLKSDVCKKALLKNELDQVWQLHKTRNKIAHENYEPTQTDIDEANRVLLMLRKKL